MITNLIVLVTSTAWVYETVNRADASGAGAGGPIHLAADNGSGNQGGVKVPTKADILALRGRYFGVSAPDVPWSASALGRIGSAAGVRPNMVEYFVNWKQNLDTKAVLDAYKEGALPVITWEPFAGGTARKTNVKSPAYTLSTIIDGQHDVYIMQFANAVRGVKWPVVIRFAHEMNGDWYPWSENVNGNQPGQFVAAWRHVHDLFNQVGAGNVIWDWAPNVVRGARNVDLGALYPGDGYVDWLGLSAYDVTEPTAVKLVGPTLTQIRKFTRRPLLITEIGSQPSSFKPAWTADFLGWLPAQSDVVGFVWFEYTRAQGAGTDWGFDADPVTMRVFQTKIKDLRLAVVPSA